MTDTTKTAIVRADAASLKNGAVYESKGIWLPEMFTQLMRQGGTGIDGCTFRNCVIEGPGILMPIGGVYIENCDVGFDDGDVRNLLVRPVGQKVFGCITVKDTRFENCVFHYVGFTGSDAFLEQFQAGHQGARK